jgi:hypothetical protein
MPQRAEEEKPVMTWYAASIIMYTGFKGGKQDKFPIWENIVLIQAESADQALEKATKRGLEDEGDSNGTYFYEDRPATLVFAGIRKLIETQDSAKQPSDRTEVSYSQMQVDDEESLSKLVNGEPVAVWYEE